ncbi:MULTISPECIES: GAF domain-containing SpoIIE family protein phosphatase [unclassified Oceanispirochaeta]|uniref:GAF domain-containing SpoIIE family protein phosphatase n=1 Tax=unclassified Oceanispirochaeta TaxID=2635722 RepID=UPI000E0955BB|nr:MULTISPECIES: GAF domain-containing SpoIIE family protein phosphatase [unclassified Oceanispirochaeta]MBF9015633.1 SpoIIE family protein phosphatase [Oceanispirochaeta sp. M2]NPD73407.1 SpoIIE family protein phosphatase [Oceanispirochaeta sp. M1]RDG30881.1 HAMP domain-containing protein [Oceanispirochaeta sp. M1]
MKIQTRITLTSLILILGLLLSSAFLFLRFSTVYQLKNFQQDCVDLNISMSRFTDRNLSFFTEVNDPHVLSDYWMTDLIEFHNDLNTVIGSDLISRLSPVYKTLVKTREQQWDVTYNDVINPFILELNRFNGSEMADDVEKGGFYTLLTLKKSLNDQSAVRQLEKIHEYQKTLDTFLSIYQYSVEGLIDKLDNEVSNFVNDSIILIFSIISAILLISLIISSRFSRVLVRRIEQTNEQVEMMKDGSLEFAEDKESIDEFDELVHDYHYFSRNLSERLNSLKILFQDIGNSIGDHTDIGAFQETIVELGMDSVNADSGILFLVDSEKNILNMVQRVGFCPPPFPLEREVTMVRKNVEEYFEAHPLDTDTPVFGHLMQSGEALFIKDNEVSGNLPYNSSPDEWLFISSFICLPLIVGKKLMGILTFYNTEEKKIFSDMDFTFIKAYSDYTAQSIDNVFKYQSLLENREIEKEIDIAASIQKRLLPAEMPDFSIGSARIHSRPARGISGDYFDAIRLDEDKIIYTVCDVAGKGVPASMLMIMIRTILHAICHKHKSADTLLKEINYHIAGRIGVDQYATMAVFILDEKKREMSYSNAAHHPLYLFRNREMEFRSFDTEGLPIGVDRDAVFGHKRIKLHDQDYLFLFTDGLPEARSRHGAELSVEQLLRFLSENLAKIPEDLIPAVQDYIAQFTRDAKQHDDQTFLALQIRC